MKILMIAYPFPPYGGMSQRTAYFANYLAERGHRVDVIAAQPSRRFHGYDAGLLSLVSNRINVHRTFAGVLHHLRCTVRSALGNRYGAAGLGYRVFAATEKAMAPASSIEWLPLGLASGVRLCRKTDYDLLYCHGDPYIANVVACLLKKLFGTPLVIYIGDPRYFGAYSRFRGVLKHLEKNCLKIADSVVVNCPETLKGYRRHFPEIRENKYNVITDGYDEKRFNDIEEESANKFRIVYSGIFYDSLREPLELFKALGRLGKGMNWEEIELVIAGEESAKYQNIIDENRINGRVKFLGHQPHDRVISLQKGAAVLLLIGWAGGYQVPGKLFEYFAAQRPILVVRYDRDDIASRVVDRYRRGLVVNNDTDEIADAFKGLYELWKDDRLERSFDLTERKEFTWEKLSSDLERVFKATAIDWRR